MKKMALSLALVLLFVGCSEKKEEKVEQTKTSVKDVLPGMESSKSSIKSSKSSISKSSASSVALPGAAPVRVEKEVKKEIDASKLFASKCASCHGADGKRKALGKSGIIAKMSQAELLKSLMEYKKGKLNKYGMGGLMKAQLASLKDEELEALSSYISTLK